MPSSISYTFKIKFLGFLVFHKPLTLRVFRFRKWSSFLRILSCRYSILFFLLSFSFFSVEAQSSIGLKGQINNLGSPLVIKRDLFSKTQGEILNPGFGIFFDLVLNEKWALQPELLYQEQRQSYLLTGTDIAINISVMEYLRVPLLFKYNMPFKNFSLIGLAGPYGGYALSLKSGETNQNLDLTSYRRLSFSENDVRRLDFGVLLGFGIEKIIANKLKTKLTFRYNFGMLDIMKDNLSTFYNRGYSLDMGFMVPLSIFKKQKASDQKSNNSKHSSRL